VARVADRITVLRDGRTVDSMNAEPTGAGGPIIRSMVDRDLAHRFPDVRRGSGIVFCRWRLVGVHPLHPERQVIKNVDFEVRRGESSALRMMARDEPSSPEPVRPGAWAGRSTAMSGSTTARLPFQCHGGDDAGLAYVTEDRKQFG